MKQRCVVIGASHAAAAFVTGLRQDGWEGPIQVIGDENLIPYHRPPLSKALLAGEKTIDKIYIRPEAVYEKADVGFILGSRAEELDTKNREILLGNGNKVNYDKLALTVGSRVRKVSMPGDDKKGIYYLRDYNDVQEQA